MKKNRSLSIAWCVFGAAIASFLVSTKIYYDSGQSSSEEFCYSYHFEIDESVLNAAKEEAERKLRKNRAAKESELATKVPEEKKTASDISVSSNEDELYEKLPCGYVPKISPDGLRVCDAYAAKYSRKSAEKVGNQNVNDAAELCLVILLDTSTEPGYISNILRRLEAMDPSNRVTFVVPHYSRYLAENVKAIVAAGHEFLLQIPTQSSVPSRMQANVSPFLANMNPVDLVNKLHELLASTKCAIGVANTTPTLLTKSAGVMSGIADELARRGLVFLDLEPANEVVRKIAGANSDFICLRVSKKFSKGMNVLEDTKDSEVKNGDSGCMAVGIDDMPEFLRAITKIGRTAVFIPVSASIKK